MLRRFWFDFAIPTDDTQDSRLQAGCGVTAFSLDDALYLLQESVFGNSPLPPIRAVVEDIDVSTLDPNHVLPNMELPVRRGVWFPAGYHSHPT